MTESFRYYDQNAKQYVSSTMHVDMSSHYELFLTHVPAGGCILDAGCGSGRDSRYFLDRGYSVQAFDLSEEMVKAATVLTNLPVRRLSFQEMDYVAEFDGIWACASLLHVPKDQLADVFRRLAKALKPDGVLYCSFKNRDEDFSNDGRHFSCFNERQFRSFLDSVEGFSLVALEHTQDLRKERGDERWLNCLLCKSDTGKIDRGNE